MGKQGLLDDLRKIRGDGAFWIDGAYPLTAEGKLPTGQDVIFYIYALNNTNYNIAGISNGFKIYSPDGATWTGTVGQNCSRLIS